MIEEFRDFSWVLQPTAVYVLMFRGRVIYAGQSLNIANRLAQHRNNMRSYLRKGKKAKIGELVIMFDEVRVKFVDEKWLDMEERALIEKYQPRFNTRLVRKDIPKVDNIVDQPFFRELLHSEKNPAPGPNFKRKLSGSWTYKQGRLIELGASL